MILGPVPVAPTDRAAAAPGYVGRRFERHLRKLARDGAEISPSDVYTGNASIAAALFHEIGGFDERLVAYGNEDRELARRLRGAGVGMALEPAAAARQRYEKTVAELLADHRAKGRTAVAVVRHDPAARTDTRLGRRRSLRRAWASRGLGRIAQLPAAPAALDRIAASGGRFGAAISDLLIDLAADAAFEAGVREAESADVDGRDLEGDRRGDRPAPRRVAHVTTSVAFGGAERVLVTLAGALDPVAWRSVIVHPANASRLAASAERAAIEHRPVTAARGDRRGVLAIARAVRHLRPDVVHVQRAWPVTDRALLLVLGVVHRGPLVVTDHLGGPRPTWRRRLARRVAEASVDAWIAVSPSVADGLLGLGVPPRRLTVVPNGIELGRAGTPSRPATRVPAHRGAPRTILTIAQLRPQKGHDVLLEAMTRLPADVRLVLAGDGPLEATIEAAIGRLGLRERVERLGHVDDVGPLLAAADVVVLPSRYEGLPLVLLEAMDAGRPIVGTDVPGTRDLVVDGETGLLVPADDPAALAAAITRVLADRALAGRLVEAGRTCVRDRHDATAMAAAVGDRYRSVLASGRRTAGGRVGEPPGAAPGRASGGPDATLPRHSRLADLRVLTDRPVPGRAIAGGRRALDVRAALERLGIDAAVRDVPTEPGPNRGAASAAAPAADDLLVTDDGSLPIGLIRRLGPGSWAILADPRASPAVLAHRAIEAGFEVVAELRPWPSLDRPEAWLPAGRDEALALVLANAAGRNRVRAIQRRATAIAWRATGRLGRGGGVVVARRPGGAAPGEPAAPRETEGARIVLSGGRRDRNRIVTLVLPAPRARPGAGVARDPDRVILQARLPVSIPGLEREARVLEAIGGRIAGVPVLRAIRGSGPALAVEASYVPGRRLSATTSSARFGVDGRRIAAWLVQLADPDRRRSATEIAELFAPVRTRFVTGLGHGLTPWEAARLDRVLGGLADLPAAIEHRDLAPWNIRDDRGRLGVLDWESATVDGLAGPDLLYALVHLAADVRGVGEAGLPIVRRDLVRSKAVPARTARSAIRWYGAAVGLPPDAWHGIAVLTWMLHAVSEHDRLVEDVGPEAARDLVRRGPFASMLIDELRDGGLGGGTLLADPVPD